MYKSIVFTKRFILGLSHNIVVISSLWCFEENWSEFLCWTTFKALTSWLHSTVEKTTRGCFCFALSARKRWGQTIPSQSAGDQWLTWRQDQRLHLGSSSGLKFTGGFIITGWEHVTWGIKFDFPYFTLSMALVLVASASLITGLPDFWEEHRGHATAVPLQNILWLESTI